jgi:hypothetical protein
LHRRGQEPPLDRQGQEHEAELARLRQIQSGAQRHARAGAEEARQRGDDRELEEHRPDAERKHQRPVRQHRGRVELHADGDEEEAEQDVVERADVGLDLVLELGLGDQHAGDEGTEREREAGKLGEPGQAEGDEQQVEDEELVALAPHDQRQPPAHRATAADEQHGEQRGGLQRRDGELAQQNLGRRAQCRDEHEQRHDGQILEQQHAHDAATVLALELEPVGHQLDDDGRRAHGQRRAERHRALPAQTP